MQVKIFSRFNYKKNKLLNIPESELVDIPEEVLAEIGISKQFDVETQTVVEYIPHSDRANIRINALNELSELSLKVQELDYNVNNPNDRIWTEEELDSALAQRPEWEKRINELTEFLEGGQTQ